MVDKKKLATFLASTGDMCLKRRARIMVEEIDPQKTDKILDLGCGDGFYLFLLSNLSDCQLIGLDNNPDSIAAAKQFVRKKTVKFVLGDIIMMPFPNETFHKIVCSEVLEHLSDDRKGLRSMHTVLKKNGRIYITVPHVRYPFFWDPINWILQHVFGTHIRSGFWAGVWNMHDRLYSMNELKKAVKAEHFQIEKTKYITHYGLPFNHYLTNIGFRLRTSSAISEDVKRSMSKFYPSSRKTWFSYILDCINWLDARNNRDFDAHTSTVGIYLRARKV